MTRRLTLEWPDRRPFGDRDGEPVRILAVSDVLEPALNDRRNKEAMGSLDLILGLRRPRLRRSRLRRRFRSTRRSSTSAATTTRANDGGVLPAPVRAYGRA